MNKILVDSDKEINIDTLLTKKQFIINKNDTIYMEISDYSNDIELTIKPDALVHIKLLGTNINSNVHIVLGNDSILKVDSLIINGSLNVSVDLTGINASINWNYSTLVSSNNNVNFTVNHKANNTNSSLVNNGLVLGSHSLVFDITGVVDKNSSNCICLQDSKIISDYANLSRILPKLLINNYDVEAEHSAYIGSFSNNDIFYLMSRGITREEARLLLVKSFLIGKMELNDNESNNFISKINEM